MEPLTDLDHQVELVFQGEGLPLGDHVLELLPVQELHDDEEPAVVFAQVVDRDDVGVAQRRAGLGLAVEARLQLVGGVAVAGDDLEGDMPAEPGVPGLVHGAHAPAADPFDDLVPADLLDHGRV